MAAEGEEVESEAEEVKGDFETRLARVEDILKAVILTLKGIVDKQEKETPP